MSQYSNRHVTFIGTFVKNERYVIITIAGPRDEVVPHVKAIHFYHTGQRIPNKRWEHAWYDRVVKPKSSTDKVYANHWKIS